ncbi:hypothetical protein WJX73_001948 [Symbiochloris irregularis]|uniref:UBC core domain-containing protein n=1 Tax=Symbiochloris irregularis TaxID=706552 RepID=A0AAW1NWE7_9CHLO
MAGRFNHRNPAVKRILQEIKEITSDNSQEFLAEALEDNIFEWHYVVRGAPDTDFRGGIYHGRILLPADYPFKPPSFTMLTPNGRFETNAKICLSISSHHPEHWQPSWSVRTALTALVAFMPSPGRGAIGSLDYNAEERQALAAKSRLAPPAFGNADRQEISARLHTRMLEMFPEEPTSSSSTSDRGPDPEGAAASVAAVSSVMAPVQLATTSGEAAPLDREALSHAQRKPAAPTTAQWEDMGLTLLALVLLVLIAAILFRKLLMFSGFDIQAMLTQQP